jgi:hypothetical protein
MIFSCSGENKSIMPKFASVMKVGQRSECVAKLSFLCSCGGFVAVFRSDFQIFKHRLVTRLEAFSLHSLNESQSTQHTDGPILGTKGLTQFGYIIQQGQPLPEDPQDAMQEDGNGSGTQNPWKIYENPYKKGFLGRRTSLPGVDSLMQTEPDNPRVEAEIASMEV